MTELLAAPAGGNERGAAAELLAQMEVERPTGLPVETHCRRLTGNTCEMASASCICMLAAQVVAGCVALA